MDVGPVIFLILFFFSSSVRYLLYCRNWGPLNSLVSPVSGRPDSQGSLTLSYLLKVTISLFPLKVVPSRWFLARQANVAVVNSMRAQLLVLLISLILSTSP